MNLPLSTRGPSIYTRQKATTPAVASSGSVVATSARVLDLIPALPARKIRVLCVDDSATVHSLLKKILTPEEGFEIVGHAMNGHEAKKLRDRLEVDVMTLDIHMPEQSGLEYLERNYSMSHPPVVMISSVSQDDADLAIRALQLGASDYVEKPALNQLSESAEQIRAKLQTAVALQSSNVSSQHQLGSSGGVGTSATASGSHSLNHQFKTSFKIEIVDSALRIFNCWSWRST